MGNPTNHYTYKIEWSDEDEEWVGTVLELPNLSWLDKTPDQALNGIQQVARECVNDMTKQGKEPPIPLSDRYRSNQSTDVPNKETISAMREAKRVAKDEHTRGYRDMNALFAHLNA